MKTKSKSKQPQPARRKASGKKVAPRTGASKSIRTKGALGARKKEFAKEVWPSIKPSTKFIDVPEGQTFVNFPLSSGEIIFATLMWCSVSHGPKILGYYDDAHDICFISKFIE